ncbi:MAG: alternative ribosome rescue aminoacyl-tRNA hydrolase ArfB [Proteobacteria bacterium]|nr:alternative ribosome rescue aminoacyl-tRNA hydrolase ArfB [Pseudomonadota bacterium]
MEITPTLSVDDAEIKLRFIRASGPGGQNVNKVSTAVQLTFDVENSPSLPADVRRRLRALAGQRVSRDGVLTLTARRFRTQTRNRQDALDRLTDLIQQAMQVPRTRRATRPTKASVTRRLDSKKKKSLSKSTRRMVRRDDD